MNLFSQARAFAYPAFFMSLAAFGFGIYLGAKPIIETGNMIAHTALFVLMLSELFGNLSNEGSKPDRLVTWLAIFISGAVAISLISTVV